MHAVERFFIIINNLTDACAAIEVRSAAKCWRQIKLWLIFLLSKFGDEVDSSYKPVRLEPGLVTVALSRRLPRQTLDRRIVHLCADIIAIFPAFTF